MAKIKGETMNIQYFPHEKLDVYSHCLAFARQAAALVDHWPASASVRDQLDRASESHITNLARAVQLFEELEENFLADENGRPRHLRRIDDFGTSLVLNIAEGNGRFSHLDHGKFIDIAEESGIKLAAYLDLVEVSCTTDIQSSKRLLREVMAMLSGLKGYLGDEGKD